jgi:hypothetical protein
VKKENLKINHIYRIDYANPYYDQASYHGNAILQEIHDDELWFDLIDRKEKGCIFFEQDVVKEIGRVNELMSFDPDEITRIVVVGERGREFEKMFDKCEISLQDDGRTVKFFTK